jgi:hypothetical protein
MSYYGVYKTDLNYMTCADCRTEAFAWMAEVFVCPRCGSNKYLFPIHIDANEDAQRTDDREECSSVSGMQQVRMERKRKRGLSSESDG